MIFKNRTQAAHSLAHRINQLLKTREHPSALIAISRGGVLVAAELSSLLSFPYDYLVMHPVFAPWDSTLLIGAVAETGTRWIQPEFAKEGFGDYSDEVEDLFQRELLFAYDQAMELRGGRDLLDLDGANVVLVDDGSSDEVMLPLARLACQEKNAAKISFAAPVLPKDIEEEAKKDFSSVTVLEHLPGRIHVSAWYEDFDEVSDDELASLLAQARKAA